MDFSHATKKSIQMDRESITGVGSDRTFAAANAPKICVVDIENEQNEKSNKINSIF